VLGAHATTPASYLDAGFQSLPCVACSEATEREFESHQAVCVTPVLHEPSRPSEPHPSALDSHRVCRTSQPYVGRLYVCSWALNHTHQSFPVLRPKLVNPPPVGFSMALPTNHQPLFFPLVLPKNHSACRFDLSVRVAQSPALHPVPQADLLVHAIPALNLSCLFFTCTDTNLAALITCMY
jgi:hypothetical protein